MSKSPQTISISPEIQECALPDGRKLSYREYGSPSGSPVLYFHGFPGASSEIAHGHAEARELGVRLIAVDRPGICQSSFQAQRRLLDWPGDVAALLDHLGLARCRVIGCSGGGPYALACARGLPERVQAVTLICPMGPADHPEVLAALPALSRGLLGLSAMDWLTRILFAPSGFLMSGGEGSFLVQAGSALVRSLKPPADRRVLSDPDVLNAKIKAGQDAFRQGSRGVAWDGRILGGSWGFSPGDVTVPVRLYHGELDDKVPPIMTRVLSKLLPVCRANFFEEDGHSSIYVDHWKEILEQLIREEFPTTGAT